LVFHVERSCDDAVAERKGRDQKVPRAVFGAQTMFFAPYTRPDQTERASEPREAEPNPEERYIGAADNPRG